MQPYHIEVQCIQAVEHGFRIFKSFPPFKRGRALAAIFTKNAPGGIQMQYVQRNFELPELFHQIHYIVCRGFGFMPPGAPTISAYLKSQRKLRKQGRFPRYIGIHIYNRRKIGPMDKIISNSPPSAENWYRSFEECPI